MKTTYVYVAREEVCAYDENKCWSTIGVYETQDRALEVLDEIQKMLDGRWIKEKMPSASMQNIFPIMLYEMPEE